MKKIRSYSEMIRLETFEERFDYLKLLGSTGISTFGFDRYINQRFYRSLEWKRTRQDVILRDSASDLAMLDRPIYSKIFIHHINPLTSEEFIEASDFLFDLENLVCCSLNTHNAIHFGNENSLHSLPIKRKKGDTRLW